MEQPTKHDALFWPFAPVWVWEESGQMVVYPKWGPVGNVLLLVSTAIQDARCWLGMQDGYAIIVKENKK